MSLTLLSPSKILGTGSELWFLPPVSLSSWFTRIDWLLNVSFYRLDKHQIAPVKNELQAWSDDQGLNLAPLEKNCVQLVASQSLLPNKATLQVPLPPNPSVSQVQDWLQHCYQIWKRMDALNARIFLPDKINPNALVSPWLGHEESLVSYVYENRL